MFAGKAPPAAETVVLVIGVAENGGEAGVRLRKRAAKR
jgi:hypothetical protein